MINSSHHPIIFPFIKNYSFLKMNRSFQSVQIYNESIKFENSVLLLMNHQSWWDGIWALYLNSRCWNKKVHFMMLESQLQKHWHLRYCGGYSIKPKSKSMLESIEYSIELLNDKNNLVLIFPQGEIQSMHHRDISFKAGVERILKRQPNSNVVFGYNLIDYFSNPKPNLYMYVEEYLGKREVVDLHQDYLLFQKRTLQSHINNNRI